MHICPIRDLCVGSVQSRELMTTDETYAIKRFLNSLNELPTLQRGWALSVWSTLIM